MKNSQNISTANATSTPAIVKEKQSWWDGLTEGQRTTINTVGIAVGVSAVAIIAVKFGQQKIQNVIANKEENNSFGNDQHATWAKQIKMAFDNNGWWGTDENALRQTLLELPSQEDFQEVQTSYRKLYKGRNLIEDLTSELKTTEFNEMLAILQSKPKRNNGGVALSYDPTAGAKRLYNALNIYYMGFIPGTDEDAITAVFNEMPSQQAFHQTAIAYQTLYATPLADDLDSDLNWTMDWRSVIEKKKSS